MKSLLARLSQCRATGVFIGEDEIAVSQVAATPLGPVEIYRHSEPLRLENLSATLHRVLDPLVGKRARRRRLVAFALPLQRIFYCSRPLKATNVEVSPVVVLHEVLRSATSNVDEMAIDLIKANPGKRPIVSLVSCRKKYLATLLGAMQECNIRPYRVEAAPNALVRAAEQQHRAPRRSKSIVRLFLGGHEGLAVLSVSGWPLMPRTFSLDGTDIASAIVSIVRTLDTLGKLCGSDADIDTVLIHGGVELRERVERETLEKELATRIEWYDGPGRDAGSIALGVAMGCIQSGPDDFDLARSMKPRPTIWELFPLGEVAAQVAAVLLLGLFLLNRSQELNTQYAAVRSETIGRHWLTSMNQQQLDKEKNDLSQRVDAIRKFLSTRIVWAAYTHDIPLRLPENATLSSFRGVCEIEKKGRKDDKAMKPKKSFTLRIEAPIANDGTAPKEIDGVLDSLRNHPLLKRDFPLVELDDIKWYQPFVGAKPTAFFNVVCLPKPGGTGGGAAPDAAGGKKSGH
jgi:hypothetical protein